MKQYRSVILGRDIYGKPVEKVKTPTCDEYGLPFAKAPIPKQANERLKKKS